MKRVYFLMMLMISTISLIASCSNNDVPMVYEPQPFESSGKTKTLVAYFSATGNTHALHNTSSN